MDSKEGEEELFPYLDKKLDDLLGHERKYFFKVDANGRVTKEALGPKWGVYGSFLPAYLRIENSSVPNANMTQNPFKVPAMVPRPSVAPHLRGTFARNPSVFPKPTNGPSGAMQNSKPSVFPKPPNGNGPSSSMQNPKPSVFPKPPNGNGPSSGMQNPKPSVFPKPPNGPSSATMQNPKLSVSPKPPNGPSSSTMQNPKPSMNFAKPSDNSVKPFLKLVDSSDHLVKPSYNAVKPFVKPPDKSVTVKPSENPVNPSEMPVKASEKTVKPSFNMVNSSDNSAEEPAKAVRIASPKRRLKIKIKLGSLAKKEAEMKSEIERGQSANEELYNKLGLGLSPSSSLDKSPELILKNVASFPVKAKQTLSPLSSRLADLYNKKTISSSNKMKPCSKLSSPQFKLMDKGKKVINETFNAKTDLNQERESLSKERETKAPSQVKIMEFKARALNGSEKGQEKKQINCPKREIAKDRKTYESISFESNGKKSTVEKEATRMVAQGKATSDQKEATRMAAPQKDATVEKEATRMAAQEKAAADQAAKTSDDWVECDRCRKWRMLPNWMKPDDLPDKWVCHMMTWLGAGMNSCKLSEDETTRALNAVHTDPLTERGPSKKDASLVPAGTVKTGTSDLKKPAGAVPKIGTNGMRPAGGVPKTGTNGMRPAGAEPKTGTNGMRPAGAVPKTGTNGMRPAGAVVKAGTEGMRPAGAAPKIGAKHVGMPAGTGKADLKKANDGGDQKLIKRRAMDQPADNARPSKKPNKNEPEPSKKPGNKVPEPGKKPGNKIPEPAKKPGNQIPIRANKPGNEVPELVKKPDPVLKRQNGGEILSSDSSLKRRKTEQEPSIEKEKLERAQELATEAQDFKKRAERLKNLGVQDVSLTMYFHAGLKFLDVARLYEPLNLDGFKAGDADKSIQIYIDTADLFEYCAKEYGAVNEKARAALSYKCMEMSLMRASFLKKPAKLMHYQNLQSALQMIPDGSPQRPASSVENLHLSSTSNDAESHNIPVSLKNLMNYGDDMSRAFDATQRCYESFLNATDSEKTIIENCIYYAFGNMEKFIDVTQDTACSF